MGDTLKTPESSCSYIVGEDGLSRWSEMHADAWVGLLETTKRLTRDLDAELESAHGIGLSGLELLGRLASAPERRLQLSVLAGEANLSLSRVSRVVDSFERRGLVERRQCPRDARSVEAQLTEAGLTLAREAQATHFASVQRRFFAELDPDEISTLAVVFARFAPRAASSCDADRSAVV